MRKFLSFVKKEIYHITRDKRTMLIVLGMPIVMIILFGFALSTEIRNINVAVLAPEPDDMVRKIAERLDANEYFTVKKYLDTPDDIHRCFKSEEIDLVLAFGKNFSGSMFTPEGAQMQFVIDAGDGNVAQTIATYTGSIITELQAEMMPYMSQVGIIPEVSLLYNPQMKSSYNFVPGIMGLILMIICAMMTAISIVREKETGTMEVLLVSPVKPIYIILAKMVPYFIISFINLVTIMLMAVFVLKVPVAGGLPSIILLSVIYIMATLALGLLISTVSKTQAVAMLFSGMLLLLPSILLSGMIFPIESMPKFLQYISNIVPATWYISAVKKLMIQGLAFKHVLKETLILSGMLIVLLAISLKNFKNRLE